MAFAQQRGDIFDEYSPPAMFGAPLTGLQEVEKEPLAPLTPHPPALNNSDNDTRNDTLNNTGEYRSPRYRPNIPIISNDDILGRSLVAKPQNNTSRQSQATFKPFTPTLPPRRPERFSLSPDMIAQMRGEAATETPARATISNAPNTTLTAARRNITENQKIISFHEAQEGNLQIIEMDVRDVLHNIDPREAASIEPSVPAFTQGHIVTLSYDSDDNVNLSKQHIAKLNQVVLSYLQDSPQNRIEIAASSGNTDIVQARRNALSRALAIRAYLEKNGIEPQKAVIKALGNQTPENASENLTFITLQ
jgi:outer membrane protein OmpA-like peptidoglycan-associated protein